MTNTNYEQEFENLIQQNTPYFAPVDQVLRNLPACATIDYIGLRKFNPSADTNYRPVLLKEIFIDIDSKEDTRKIQSIFAPFSSVIDLGYNHAVHIFISDTYSPYIRTEIHAKVEQPFVNYSVLLQPVLFLLQEMLPEAVDIDVDPSKYSETETEDEDGNWLLQPVHVIHISAPNRLRARINASLTSLSKHAKPTYPDVGQEDVYYYLDPTFTPQLRVSVSVHYDS